MLKTVNSRHIWLNHDTGIKDVLVRLSLCQVCDVLCLTTYYLGGSDGRRVMAQWVIIGWVIGQLGMLVDVCLCE